MRRTLPPTGLLLTGVLLTGALLAGALLAGCEAGSSGALTTSRDSAGVRITVVPESELQVREIVGEPRVAIGTAEGPAETVFGRIAGAQLLSDGRIAVADAFAPAVRLFDGAGRLLGSLGRTGNGPGEFGSIIAFGRYRGDSVYVSELGARRTTVFDSRSGGARVVPASAALPEVADAAPSASCCELKGAGAHGGFLLSSPEWSPLSGGARARGQVVIGWMSGEGGAPRVLGRLDGAEYRPAASGNPRPYSLLHHGNRLSLAVVGEGFAATDGLGYRIDLRDRNGELIRATTVTRPRAAVTAAHRDRVESYYDSIAARVGGDLEASGLHWAANRPFADSLPGYTALHTAADGTLWADFSASTPDADSQQTFDVLDPEGGYRTSIRLPPGRRFLDADEQRLLLRAVDALGVERVEVWSRR